jgi:hypothetical protein
MLLNVGEEASGMDRNGRRDNSAYDEEIDLQGLPEATIETIPDHSVHKLPDSIRLPAQV